VTITRNTLPAPSHVGHRNVVLGMRVRRLKQHPHFHLALFSPFFAGRGLQSDRTMSVLIYLKFFAIMPFDAPERTRLGSSFGGWVV